MHKRTRYLSAALVCAISVAGCGGSSDTAPTHALSGTWSGAITGNGQTLALTLLNVGTEIDGTGSISPTPSGSQQFNVSGSYDDPSFSLTLTYLGTPSIPTITVSGSLTGANQLTTTISGAGYAGQSVVLTKASGS